ncbi:MAG TPA: hypothetical protein DCX37_09030, partial [Firmicutes bacterium]|nr:hypothetical protein [Bacillota bacterium]
QDQNQDQAHQDRDQNGHFSADARHYAGIPITLSCDQPGVYHLDALAFYNDDESGSGGVGGDGG